MIANHDIVGAWTKYLSYSKTSANKHAFFWINQVLGWYIVIEFNHHYCLNKHRLIKIKVTNQIILSNGKLSGIGAEGQDCSDNWRS